MSQRIRRFPLPLALFVLLALLAVLATSRAASANGRFPKAQQVVTVPGSDGKIIFLRATFGVLISRDAGASWRWLCEQAMGFSGTWDPPIAATKDGRLWAGLPDGLSSTLDGCEVLRVPELAGELVADLSNEPGGERLVLVTSTPGKPAHVWRKKSGKEPFSRLGAGVTGVTFDTVDVAPSLPARLYATAAPVGGGRRAHLFRSDDGGVTLNELDVKLAADGRLFLSAIDPRDPDRLFVRHTNEAGTDLLLSTDGGKTFTSVLRTRTSMFGFAAAEGGASLYAGAGDATEGLFRSRDRGVTWEPASKTSVLCLFADGPRLFACSNPFSRRGWAVAVSTDAASSFRPLTGWSDVKGPLACEAGAGAACGALWEDLRAQIVAPQPPASPASIDQADLPADAGAVDGGAADAPGSPPSKRWSQPLVVFTALLSIVVIIAITWRAASRWLDRR